MADIVWLASYPKSGNTWIRALLTNYLRRADTPADINALDTGPIASSRVWFDEWAGIEASALSNAVIMRLRPQVYRCLAREATERLYIKAHDAWQLTDAQEALFPVEITTGVLYIVRNPLDIVASLANHLGVSQEQAVDHLCDSNFMLARSRGGIAEQLRQTLGSWSDHVRSWVDDSGLPIHVVRYEDLWRDSEMTFAGVVRFLGLPFEADQIRRAAAFSDFAELCQQEQAHGFRERSVRAPDAFFRRGRVGGGREELTPAMIDRLLAAHGQTMRRFAYTDA